MKASEDRMHCATLHELIARMTRLYRGEDHSPVTTEFLHTLELLEDVVHHAVFTAHDRPVSPRNSLVEGKIEHPFFSRSVRSFFVDRLELWNDVTDAYPEYELSPNLLLVEQVVRQAQEGLSTGAIDKGDFFRNMFDRLIERVRCNGRSDDWISERQKRRNLVMKRRLHLDSYLRKLFSVNDALQVVQVDLGYARRFSKEVSQERVRVDWRRFFDNGRRRTFFKNRAGYFWVLVPGYRRYCSSFAAVFLYRPEKCDESRSLGTEICQFWCDSITNGQGVGFDHDSAGAKSRIANNLEEILPESGQRGLSLFTDLEWCFLRKRAAERKNGLPRIETFGHGEIKIRRRA